MLAFRSMEETWRFLDIGSQDPFQAVGRMPIMGGWVQRTGRPLLMTAVWGATHVNVGWFDDVDATLDLARCRELGVEVIRRPMFGGGTAYYEEGRSVMASFLLPRDEHADLDRALLDKQPIFLDALARLGLQDVVFEGSSDLRWNGRKLGALISQDAMTSTMVGGFLNIGKPDVERFLEVARIPDEKFKDKVVKDLRDYIATAPEVAGREVTYEDFRDALVAACEAAGIEFVHAPLTDEEESQAKDFTAYLRSDANLRSVSSERFTAEAPEGTQVGFANHKGKKLCRAGVAVGEGSVIAAAMFAGDMHVSPPDTMVKVAAAVVGASVDDDDELRRRVAEVFEADEVHQPDAVMGVTTDDLMVALTGAIAAAQR